MGYSIKATLDCNGECRSCYENRIRRKSNPGACNVEAVLKTLDGIIEEEARKPEEKRVRYPGLHGGEPTVLPLGDFERLLSRIHDFWGQTGIQTNGLRTGSAQNSANTAAYISTAPASLTRGSRLRRIIRPRHSGHATTATSSTGAASSPLPLPLPPCLVIVDPLPTRARGCLAFTA